MRPIEYFKLKNTKNVAQFIECIFTNNNRFRMRQVYKGTSIMICYLYITLISYLLNKE